MHLTFFPALFSDASAAGTITIFAMSEISSANPAAETIPTCSDKIWRIGLVLIVALYVLIRLPLLNIPLVRDEGLFGVAAQALLRGQTLYRDVFDLKPPGIFYIYALGLKFVPPTPSGLHGFLHAWNFITLLLVISIAKELRGRVAGLWSGWLFAAYSAGASIDGHTACTEIFLLLPVAASFRIALAARKRESASQRYLLFGLSGIFGAAACWIKQPAALLLLTLPVFLIVEHGIRNVRRAAADFSFWFLGGIVLSLLICLAFRPVWSEFIYWSFKHALEYSSEQLDWQKNLGTKLPVWGQEQAFPILACVGGLAVGISKRSTLALTGLAFFLLSTVAVAHSPHFFGHYFALTCLALALVGGISLAALTQSWSGRPPAWSLGIVGASILPLVWATPNYKFDPWNAEFEAAAFLRQRTSPEEPILMYCSDPEVLFLAERKSTNPFMFLDPLMRGIARQSEFQRLAWSRVEEQKPAYIVFSAMEQWIWKRGIDEYFVTQLTALKRDGYHLESVLAYDLKNHAYQFFSTYEELNAKGCPAEPIVLRESERKQPKPSQLVRLMEFWRRNN
jgi:hypothetical protein